MRPANIKVFGQPLVLDPSGVLFWPEHRMLVVADLHFEKGASFARRGAMLPPHDTLATLERLERVLARLDPLTVVSLGDGFHDRRAAAHLPPVLANRIRSLTSAYRWLWVSGNHDPEPPVALGGTGVPQVDIAGLVLRHEPCPSETPQIVGHFHPRAKVRLGQRTARLGCFVTDGRRMVLPAFGAFTGGLNVLDQAFGAVLGASFTTYVLGETSCRQVPHRLLVRDMVGSRYVLDGVGG